MCLILFAYDPQASTPFIVAANRDEFFNRATAPADFWEDNPNILAGKDLVGLGTWIGITKTGRFAAVTNVREPGVVVEDALSRGHLTRNFLAGTMSPQNYLEGILAEQMRYSGFNLLVGEFSSNNHQLYYLSNRHTGIIDIQPGIYGLSNHLLDSPWPKVTQGKQWLTNSMNKQQYTGIDHQQLRDFLEKPDLAEDALLPSTGVSYEREKALSAAFIRIPNYGTRTSTVLEVSNEKIIFSEKNYTATDNLQLAVEGEEKRFFIERGVEKAVAAL